MYCLFKLFIIFWGRANACRFFGGSLIDLIVSHSFLEPGRQLLRVSSHFCCWLSLIQMLISLLSSCILGFVGFSFLILPRLIIRLAILVGMALRMFRILPAGKFLLAAFCSVSLKIFLIFFEIYIGFLL